MQVCSTRVYRYPRTHPPPPPLQLGSGKGAVWAAKNEQRPKKVQYSKSEVSVAHRTCLTMKNFVVEEGYLFTLKFCRPTASPEVMKDRIREIILAGVSIQPSFSCSNIGTQGLSMSLPRQK